MGCHEFSSQSLANLSKGAIFGAKKDMSRETWVVYRLTVDYKMPLVIFLVDCFTTLFMGILMNFIGIPYEATSKMGYSIFMKY